MEKINAGQQDWSRRENEKNHKILAHIKEMDITTNTVNIKRILKEYFGQLYGIQQLGKIEERFL